MKMMKFARGIPAAAALMAAMVFGGPQAFADVVPINFSGAGYNVNGLLTIVPNVAPADPNTNCGTAGNNACRTDPPGAFMISGITGTFSDANSGISNASITSLVPINPANERDPVFDPLVPSSLSFVDYGTPPNAGALTYNNLFFPDGSPIDCAYPFSGTLLDVFGMAFTVEGGYTVDLWGDGNVPGRGNTYGVGVTNGISQLSYAFNGVNAVPEPGSLALFGAGLLGMMLVWRKRAARLGARGRQA